MKISNTLILFGFLFLLSTARALDSISVIGLGRLGLCTALCFERAGFNVVGVDISEQYVANINTKSFSSNEPYLTQYLSESKNFKATTSLDFALEFSDIYFIVVDTPTSQNHGYDHTKLSKLLSNINKRKVANKHIVICCTVFPGYINEIASILLRDCCNVSISYNPEFIAQGSIITNFENPDMVLIGEGSQQAGDILELIYKRVCRNAPIICRMSPQSAEITKLAINCFITTKIAYANMISDIADCSYNANKFDILRAVGSDTRIGKKCLNPGYGFGGPCFPRDNRALGAYASTIGVEALLPSATDRANKLHAELMAASMLKENKDCYIFEDVNYKENCPVIIIEESQKLVVAELLAKKGKTVIIKDKSAVIEDVIGKYGSLFKYEAI